MDENIEDDGVEGIRLDLGFPQILQGVIGVEDDELAIAGDSCVQPALGGRRRTEAAVIGQQKSAACGVTLVQARDRTFKTGLVAGGENDLQAVVRQTRLMAEATKELISVGIETHPLGRAGSQIAHEDIAPAVGVIGDQIGRARPEGHHAAVVGQGGLVAVQIGLQPGVGQADTLDLRGGGPAQQGQRQQQSNA